MIHAYVRISVGREEEAVSLEYQERDIHNAYDSQYSDILIHRESASAVKNDRPVWEALLKKLKSGDTLLAWSVDRLMRNIHDLPLLSRLMDSGVRVQTVRDGDFTPESIFMFGVKALVAVEEPRRLKQRQTSRYEEAIKKGEWFFPVPLGYLRENGKVLKDTTLADAIPQLFRGYLAHTGGVGSFLPEAQKILLPYGKKISKGYLHRILRNPFYTGKISFRGTTGKGNFSPLIPDDLFTAVQNKLDGKRQIKDTVHSHLYRGRVICLCGRTLSGELQKGRVYYRCHNRDCSQKTIREDILDNCVSHFFQKYDVTQKCADYYLARVRNDKDGEVKKVQKERELLSRSITEADKKLSGFMDMRATGEIDAETFIQKRDATKKEIASLNERFTKVGNSLHELF
jgi:site-specific DNA recombinase